MANDRLIRKLQQVDVVRRDLAAFLDRLGVAIRAGIANLRRGVPASEQTPDASAVHIELVQKLDDMHHAVHEARVEGVRVLVEDEGLPVSMVAQLMGRPRQLVARLYQQARNGSGSGAVHANGSTRRSNGAAAFSKPPVRRAPAADRTAGGPRTRMPPAAQ